MKTKQKINVKETKKKPRRKEVVLIIFVKKKGKGRISVIEDS